MFLMPFKPSPLRRFTVSLLGLLVLPVHLFADEEEERTKELLQALREGDRNGRYQAVSSLADRREWWSEEIEAALLDALKNDPDEFVRARAAAGLMPVVSRPEEAIVAALASALNDRSAYVRQTICWQMGSCGKNARGALPALRAALAHVDKNTRIDAAAALADVDPESELPIDTLIELLLDGDAKVRARAATCLSDRGPRAHRAVPSLRTNLKHRDREARLCAVSALRSVGPEARPAIPDIVPLLKDADEMIRMIAAASLARLDQDGDAPVTVLVQFLRDRQYSMRLPLAARFVRWTVLPVANNRFNFEQAKTYARLIESVKATNTRTRAWVAEVLGELGLTARAALPALTETLEDETREVRKAAAEALESIQNDHDDLRGLMRLLRDGNAGMRRAAAGALEARETLPNSVRLALRESLRTDPDFSVRAAAARALARVQHPNPAMIQALGLVVRDDASSEVRWSAAGTLEQLGRAARDAIGHLELALRHDDTNTRLAAASAIRKIDPDNTFAIHVLNHLLKEPHWTIRSRAARMLGEFGPKAAEAAPALAEALRKTNIKEEGGFSVRIVTIGALRSIGPPAAAALPALKPFLADEIKFVRFQAAWAMTAIDPENEVPIAVLIQLLQDRGAAEKLTVAGKIGLTAALPLDGVRLDVLKARREIVQYRRQLDGQEQSIMNIRVGAANLLGQMGAKAHAAVPALTEASKDESEMVRTAAAKALEKIKAAP